MQLKELKRGFNSIIQHEWLSFMTVQELESQLCGQTEIKLDDWKNNTEYKGFVMGAYSPVVLRFWQVMETYSQKELQQILQFCTGSNRLPLGGFSELQSESGQKSPFTIQSVDYVGKIGGPMSNLPRAHTCFNRLDLPRYTSFEYMKTAIDYIA